MSGWIKLHRGVKSHWIYGEKRKFSKFEAWVNILLTVNYAPSKSLIKGKLIEVNRGESILSLDSWALNWGWDKSSVRRFLELLQKDNMIVLKNETITTRLTVCNYDIYQDERHAGETQKKRKRNAGETQTTPIKKEEESKEEKELKKSISNDIDSRKLKFAESLKEFVGEYSRELVKEFYDYWTEPNKSNTKFKQEMCITWETKRRLETWAKNDKNFKSKSNGINTQKPLRSIDDVAEEMRNRTLARFDAEQRAYEQAHGIRPQFEENRFEDTHFSEVD